MKKADPAEELRNLIGGPGPMLDDAIVIEDDAIIVEDDAILIEEEVKVTSAATEEEKAVKNASQ